jgi:uncharacterized protein YggE
MNESQEKRLYGLVLILVVVVALLGAFAIYTSYRAIELANRPAGPEAKIISVGGTGIVYTSPDMGWFVVSVTTQAGTASDAEQQNNDLMSKVITALMSAGIVEKDIKTTDFSLTPIYQESKEPGKPPMLVGYQARHTINVTVNDLTQIGKILDLAISSGANEVGGVYFGLSQPKADQAQAQALDLAVKDANSKATTIADAMGVKLVGPTSVSLGYYYEPVRMDAQAVAKEAPIMPGQLQYSVTVQINYAFS